MPAPAYGHWDINLVGRFNPDEHLGFVYQITHLETGKSYIGCKHLWRFKKRKKVKASEWRYYCSSSNYLKPDIKKYGKRAFSFVILMLCPNKRDLYYNETKLQMELGVLESSDYYNANVGGMRFYRPVNSYITMDVFKGVKNPAYKGNFYILYESGIEELVEDKTVKQWCVDNNYGATGLFDLRSGKIKRHKNIISMEYQSERT
tara:strand:- start:16689 stop:17300 length:612 start_codon:yes stop_codon:yes gene_type:complete